MAILHGWHLVADKLLHIVVPVLVMIGWFVFGPRGRVDWRDIGRFLILPVVWFTYTLVHGAISDWYPYPFVDVGENGYLAVT